MFGRKTLEFMLMCIGDEMRDSLLEYKSAIAFGKAEEVTDEEEKRKALRAICLRFLPNHMDAFEAAVDRSMSRTAIVRITLSSLPTGKRKQYDSNGDEMKYGRME